MDRFRYMDGVATVRLVDAACNGCGMCEEVCPHGVFAVAEGKARILDRDACMECGACSRNCPVEALSVTSGVGCATAVINSMLGRKKASCCVIGPSCGDTSVSCCTDKTDRTTCC